MSKILLVTENIDTSTSKIIDWLEFYKEGFLRINTDVVFYKEDFMMKISNSSVHLELSNRKINLDNVKTVFFRKYSLRNPYELKGLKYLKLRDDINRFFISELHGLRATFFAILGDKRFFNQPERVNRSYDKNWVLLQASMLGLKIPNTYLTNSSNYLKQIKNKKIVSKAIDTICHFTFNKKTYSSYTSVVREKVMKLLPNIFFPSLYQDQIDKKYEIRVFHINGKNYSMAIFSQNDRQTSVDFRKYNYSNPNRFVPYNLPTEIDLKICKLMTKLELTSGSIDIIKDLNEDYVFLEVNPNGQYGMVEMNCNYSLSKEIVKYLIK